MGRGRGRGPRLLPDTPSVQPLNGGEKAEPEKADLDPASSAALKGVWEGV